ncbi:thioredoxin domain-containing protein, partial [Candidatus Woesearchaeota archaeon]|nr:thioredoxin domain-containing protein [Candidatus Woesearchaeota archaeon]
MALKTLDGMHGGIYDKVDFGFFRYSVTQDWKMPHYEKMLDTNAGLLRNYAVAYDITKDKKFQKIVEETIGYINKFLSNQQDGGFYGSQDADEEFYHSKLEERKKKKYPYVDKTIYADWNAMMISSYIKAGTILNDSKSINFAIKTVDFILKNCYSNDNGLFHYFDGKANTNGLLSDNIYFLDCLIDAYSITRNQEYLKKIKEIA